MYVTYSDLIQTGIFIIHESTISQNNLQAISDAIFCEILHHWQKVMLFPGLMLALIQNEC